MAKIWQKTHTTIHPVVERYCTGTDYIFDMFLLPYDIKASLAQARMLESIKIITNTELMSLEKGLAFIENEFENGRITITPEDEDCHTVIERILIEHAGEAGKKIHTGRSRNDQVLTAIRLYMLDEIRELILLSKELAKAFYAFAKENEDTVLPGYTHAQQAMPSSGAHWALSFVESLFSDIDFLEYTAKHISKNPLGSAAAFGVSFPLDRELTRKEMGFDSIMINSLFAQGSRGKFESLTMEACSQIMMTLGRLASDMLFFTSRELGYFKVDASLTTGSSIMPQKKNLDAMELLRANNSVISANELMIKDLVKGLISGYNRDLQLMKKPLIETIQIVKDSIEIARLHVEGIEIDKEAVLRGMKADILAADIANTMVEKEGIPFRDAYVKVGDNLATIQPADFLENIQSKKSLGSPGNLGWEYYEERIRKL